MQDTKLEDIPFPEDKMNHIHSELPKVNCTPDGLGGSSNTQSQNRSRYEMPNMCYETHFPPLPLSSPPLKPQPPPMPKVENVMEYQRYAIQGKCYKNF